MEVDGVARSMILFLYRSQVVWQLLGPSNEPREHVYEAKTWRDRDTFRIWTSMEQVL